VSDIYTHNQLPAVGPEASLKDVILEISSKRLGCTAVVDKDRTLLGIITDGDLRRMLEKNTNLMVIHASDIMTTTPKRIEKDEYAVKALHLMEENNITQLVVTDGEKVAGFIHLHDLLKEGII
jgi:arabinose-5-phosphate isomerase